ncbi:hypothetical protein SAMN06265795_12622 [Noviherbaspirillum humi]|uniref:Uncharacterized protein n=1 Tax=Noviherbaspirillum humi TaxID=1688639 RepID=A0A239LU73_9BURK|nr:hypothetical protein [Noviherbaspirillum humi]SNT33428.1 hypothetical protein SAMN06265795_12622 [Noviherbaspirillum humi]
MSIRLSAWLALRCREPQFRRWLRVPDEATAVTAVRAICEVKSRSEIDRDPAAQRRFHEYIRRPYSQYCQQHPLN